MKAAVGEEGEGLVEDDNKSPDQKPVKGHTQVRTIGIANIFQGVLFVKLLHCLFLCFHFSIF